MGALLVLLSAAPRPAEGGRSEVQLQRQLDNMARVFCSKPPDSNWCSDFRTFLGAQLPSDWPHAEAFTISTQGNGGSYLVISVTRRDVRIAVTLFPVRPQGSAEEADARLCVEDLIRGRVDDANSMVVFVRKEIRSRPSATATISLRSLVFREPDGAKALILLREKAGNLYALRLGLDELYDGPTPPSIAVFPVPRWK